MACYRYENATLYARFRLVHAYLPVAVQVDTGHGFRSNSGCELHFMKEIRPLFDEY